MTLRGEISWGIKYGGLAVVGIFVSLIMAGCSADSTAESDNQLIYSDVIDSEDLFDPEQEQDLADFLDSLENKTGIDFVLCTVADPGPGGMIEYAAAMTRRISPGDPGMNNGAIIYLSDYAREVKVECGYGMEWYASDTAAGLIIESMRSFLVNGEYKEAAKKGFLGIAELASVQDWQVDSIDWNEDSTTDLKLGMIISLSGKGIGRAYQEGVPESTQFHPNYFIEFLHDGRVSNVYFSGYMRDLVDRVVYSEKVAELSCVVLNIAPVQLGLLGIHPTRQ